MAARLTRMSSAAICLIAAAILLERAPRNTQRKRPYIGAVRRATPDGAIKLSPSSLFAAVRLRARSRPQAA
jgi:hypothetical protein